MTSGFDARSSLGYALKQAQQAMRNHMDRGLSELGLTAPQYAVLAALEAEPGASNAALARQAFVTPQTMQGMLAGLERARLVERTPDPDHGRVRRAALTEAGRDALAHAHRIAAASEGTARAATGPDGADALAQTLRRVADALRP